MKIKSLRDDHYSFRLDRKYRALFIYTGEDEIEIIAITNHYKK